MRRLAHDRLCPRCAHNMIGASVEREPHYGVLIVRCARCGGVDAAQAYPLVGATPRRWGTALAAVTAFLLLILFAGSLASVFPGSIAMTMESVETLERDIDSRYEEWYRAEHPDADAMFARWDRDRFPEWWAQQDAEAIIAARGGIPAIIEWDEFTVNIVFAVIAFFWGAIWSVVYLSRRVRAIAAGSVVVCVLTLAGVGIAWVVMATQPPWDGEHVTAVLLSLPLTMGCTLVFWISFWIGLRVGRPALRGAARALLSPRRRVGLAALWRADGRQLPGSTPA